jgi:RNA polymerase sigma factor for flagellar operon FliA
MDESSLPPALVPSEPEAPDAQYERLETRDRVRAAIQSLPWRERKVIGLYYYGEVTMKQIGAEIGVNESRVSQLHARAIRRLRTALGEMGTQQVAEMRRAFAEFSAKKPLMAKVPAPAPAAAVVLAYKPVKKAMARATLKVGRQRQAVAAAR